MRANSDVGSQTVAESRKDFTVQESDANKGNLDCSLRNLMDQGKNWKHFLYDEEKVWVINKSPLIQISGTQKKKAPQWSSTQNSQVVGNTDAIAISSHYCCGADISLCFGEV